MWYIRDNMRPAFDGPLIDAKYVSGGMYVVKTITERNNLKPAYRKLSTSEQTLCAVIDENQIYVLISNPTSDTTDNSNWDTLFDNTNPLEPIGEWQADNSAPVLADTGALGLSGKFYFVTGAPSGAAFQDPTLFNGEAITVYDGDWVISVGSNWAHVRPTVTWASINRPQKIIDYENGIVQAHTHIIADVSGLQAALDTKYDSTDVADSGVAYGSVPNSAIINKQFLDTHFYTNTDIYTKVEVDGLITGYDFLSLPDTPSSYAGSANYLLRVNGAANAVEFVNGSSVYALSSHTHIKSQITDFSESHYIRTNANSALTQNVELTGVFKYTFGNTGAFFKNAAEATIYQSDELTPAVTLDTVTNAGRLRIWNGASEIVRFGFGNTWVNGGPIGLYTDTPSNNAAVTIGGTGAFIAPIGTSAQRPTAETGMIRFNSTLNEFEGYDGTSWSNLGTAAAATSFLALTDSPLSYSGKGLYAVRVNAAENSVEFVDINTLIGGGSLAGGIQGQILIKNSATDFDYSWSAPSFKLNIDGVQGTGFTGDIGTDLDEYLIAFRNENANALSASFTDIYLGPGHGDRTSYGNISIGQNNFGSLVAAGEFQGGRNILIGNDISNGWTSHPSNYATHNVYIGRKVNNNGYAGAYDVGIGYEVLASAVGDPGESGYNVAIGVWSMYNIDFTATVTDSWYTNVAIGYAALQGATVAEAVRFTGGSIVGTFQVGETVTQAGSGATGIFLEEQTTANIAVYRTSATPFSGSDTITGNTSGATFTGMYGTDNQNFNSNIVAIGAQAGIDSVLAGGFGSVLLGYKAGQEAIIEYYNVAIGWQSMHQAVVGRGNVAIGAQAGARMTGGSLGNSGQSRTQFNIGVGIHAMEGLEGYKNAFFGTESGGHQNAAGDDRVIGDYNSGFGTWTFRSLKGNYNTALGAYAGYQSNGTVNYLQGSSNTFLGHSTAWNTSNNIFNNVVVIGNPTGEGITTGYRPAVTSGNIYIGSIGDLHIDADWDGTPARYSFTNEALMMPSVTAPSTNTAGWGKIYVDSSDKLLYFRDETGVVHDLTGFGDYWKVTGNTTLGTTSANTINITMQEATSGVFQRLQIIAEHTGTNGDPYIRWEAYTPSISQPFIELYNGYMQFFVTGRTNGDITGDSASMKLNDFRDTPRGFEYYDDYGSTLSSRSLIDRGYWEANRSATATIHASNIPALPYWKTSGTTTLTGATTIDAGTNALSFSQEPGTPLHTLQMTFDSNFANEIDLSYYVSTTRQAGVRINSSTTTISGSTDSNSIAVGAGITVTGVPVKEASDYSGSYDNLSLINKGYADGAYIARTGSTTIDNTTVLTKSSIVTSEGFYVKQDSNTDILTVGFASASPGIPTAGSLFYVQQNSGGWSYHNGLGQSKTIGHSTSESITINNGMPTGSISITGTLSNGMNITNASTTSSAIDIGATNVGATIGGYFLFDPDNLNALGAGTIFYDPSSTTEGIKYAADYSAGFSTLSLIHKGYADGAYWKVNGSTTLTPDAGTYQYSRTDGINFKSLDIAPGQISIFASNSSDNKSGQIEAGATGSASIVTFDGMSSSNSLFFNSLGAITLTDQIGTKGIVYAADYSGNFTARSLIDKGYADGRYFGEQGGVFNLTNFLVIEIPDTQFWTVVGDTQTGGIHVTSSTSGESIRFTTSTGGVVRASLYMDAGDAYLGGAGVYFLDERATKVGIEYDATTASGAGFTANSLINKGYADGAYWALTGTSNLTGATTIDAGATYTLTLTSSGTTNPIRIANTNLTPGTYVQVDDNQVTAEYDDGTNYSFVQVANAVAKLEMHTATVDNYISLSSTDILIDHLTTTTEEIIQLQNGKIRFVGNTTDDSNTQGFDLEFDIPNNSYILFDGLTYPSNLNTQTSVGNPTYDFIAVNVQDGTRTSSGAANFLRFQNDGTSVFLVDVLGNTSYAASSGTIILPATPATTTTGALRYNTGNVEVYDGGWKNVTKESIVMAVSDETTALTTGTAKFTFRMPYAFTLTGVRASVNTAPTGSTIIVDINEGGVSVLSTLLSIDATEKTSTTAASAAVISDSSLADDAEITIDIDQVGSTIAGAGLKVTLLGYRT